MKLSLKTIYKIEKKVPNIAEKSKINNLLGPLFSTGTDTGSIILKTGVSLLT